MSKIISNAIIFIFISSLTSCGWLGLRDRSGDYLLAEETAPTAVPVEMDSAGLGQAYPIPQIEIDSGQLSSYEVPRPQAASVNTFEQLVKIQSFDERRWILINIAPGELWPRLRSVLNRSGVPSARAEGSSGLIETVWVTFNSDEENSHRFRFNITPGVQIDSTEISAIHNQVARGVEESGQWPTTSDSDQRELDMMTLVANELAEESNFASVSLLAQDIGGSAKVDILSPKVTDPYVRMKLGFDRSWASLVYSAERGFTTIDKNRSQGELFVNYTEASSEELGFFGRIFGGGKEQDIIKANYQILVQTVGSDTEVRVVDAKGSSLTRVEALKLLTILRSNLS
jgi:outer membrane protein assembly factor BamC